MPDLARLHYAWVVAALTCLLLAVSAGMRAAPGVLPLPLQQGFGWSAGSISFAFGVSLRHAAQEIVITDFGQQLGKR